MLRLHWIEIFLRLIPEMLLIIWGIHVIAKKTINIRKYILLSIIMALTSFGIRWLPIYFGVHTFIICILTICVMAIIGIPILKAICSTLIMLLLLCISEFINEALLNSFNICMNAEVLNPVERSILGFPALIIMFLSISALSYFIKNRQVKNWVS